MAIFRIVPRLGYKKWPFGSTTSDQFVDAEDEKGAEEKFKPAGKHEKIFSIEETPFTSVDDPKWYLVGVGMAGSPNGPDDFKLVQVRNGDEACKVVEEDVGIVQRMMQRKRALRSIMGVRYLGQIDPLKVIQSFS